VVVETSVVIFSPIVGDLYKLAVLRKHKFHPTIIWPRKSGKTIPYSVANVLVKPCTRCKTMHRATNAVWVWGKTWFSDTTYTSKSERREP